MPRWKENGWRTASGEPVKNRAELEAALDALDGEVPTDLVHGRPFRRDPILKADEAVGAEQPRIWCGNGTSGFP